MGLFSKKKASSPPSSIKSAGAQGSSASVKSDLGLSSSNESLKSDASGGKIKGLLKKKLNGASGAASNGKVRNDKGSSGDVDKISADLGHANIGGDSPKKQTSGLTLQVPPHGGNGTHMGSEGPCFSRYKRRVSTIIESEHNSSGEDEDEDEDDGDSAVFSDTSESDLEEDHLHPIKPKYDATHHDLAQQLSTIMGYCGLLRDTSCSAEEANNESQRTYSLLDQENKIKKLPKSVHNDESIIGEYQIQLIRNLSSKIENLINDGKNEKVLTREKSLYQRYGVVRNVIGKGAYGLIKFIDPEGNKNSSTLSSNNLPPLGKRLYVVKELSRRKDEKTDNFIERIMSEFVISSTLNSKYIIETVDLMGTLSPTSAQQMQMQSQLQSAMDIRISQVMNCSSGGDLFSYLLTGTDINNKTVKFMSLYEVDCILKQVARGLKYMHAHGVAHCDLKLENILISYQPDNEGNSSKGDGGNFKNVKTSPQSKMSIKLSDFGKSFVFRTSFDKSEQKLQGSQGAIIGSEPYIPPEEYLCNQTKSSYSSVKKDCWAFGIVALALLNIRRHYYSYPSAISTSASNGGAFRSGSKLVAGNDADGYSTGYLWKNTESKSNSHNSAVINGKDGGAAAAGTGAGASVGGILSRLEFKDKVFVEYVKKRMVGDYDCKSKEWLIKRPGKFMPIENICKPMRNGISASGEEDECDRFEQNGAKEKEVKVDAFGADVDDEDEDDLSELRVLILYKLLDLDPSTRMTMDQFLKSDWMTATESCF
ncbi:HAL5 [Candida theae]|uniref:HAL5 n=1 Tax=Candida theae TaxID=1198502 RepID=A0AAD5BIH9_9ASCO|nr:HAL5 [Candida theae]KAI5965480.1 HAL5 [Candida theae]